MSYWLETRPGSTTKSRLAWCFGIPQIPLPPLTETSVLTGSSTTYWPNWNGPGSTSGSSRGGSESRRAAVRATLYSMYFPIDVSW